MRLYRIMLVDDEAEVRESIIKKIDWESAGFQLAGDAENGADALEKIEILEPDIVLTDIRMPYMDGLELARRIHQSYPSIKLVIFSGFDEFEYAKQAIRLNVTEYILKPVNVDELTQILGRIKQNLDDELRRRRSVEALRESFVKNLPILRERFLYDLTHGRVEPGRIPGLLTEYNIDIAGACSWAVAHAVIDALPETCETDNSGAPLQVEAELIPVSVRKTLEDMLGGYARYASFSTPEGICAVVALDADASFDQLIAVLNDVCRECKRALGLNLTAGLGRPVESLDKLSSSCRESVEAVGYKAVMNDGGAIFIGDVERSHRPAPMLDRNSENDLISAIKFGGPPEIEAVTKKIADEIQKSHPYLGHLQFYAVGLTAALLQLASTYELDPPEIFGPQQDFLREISSIGGTDALYRWLLKLGLRLGAMIHEGRSSSAHSIVEEAKLYIQENFRDPELSLESLCSHLHISAAYFSTIFKRETGVSYTGYLTQARLDAAVELLLHTDDKTYLVADKIGYSDPNYFSYVFKKRYGVSPTKYRSNV